jgi:SAM-dependent methyltransferase
VSSPEPDLDELRERSRRAWTGAAPGWQRRQEKLREATAPVSHWMVEAVRLQPGHRVLELAAGVGDTGFLAAELIRPGGRLISSDQSQVMLDAARARAEELGLDNVEFKLIEAEWIDLPLAAVDAVLCRWGYMLMPDVDAALRETRRVLRPGGRVALAAWESPEANPWAALPAREMVNRGLSDPPKPGQPGMFALGDPAGLEARLEDAGFTEIEVETVDFEIRHSDLDDWWQTQLDLSPFLRPTLAEVSAEAAEDFRRAVVDQGGSYVASSGEVVFPARTLVAAASA